MTTYFSSLPSEIPIPEIPEVFRWENSDEFKAAAANGVFAPEDYMTAMRRHNDRLGDPTVIEFFNHLSAKRFSHANEMIESGEVRLSEYLANGKTILHLAEMDQIEFLLGCGANPNLREYEKFDDDDIEFAGQMTKYGNAVIVKVAQSGDHKLMRLLLSFGANPNVRVNGLYAYQYCLNARDGDVGDNLRKMTAQGKHISHIDFDLCAELLLSRMEQLLLEEVVVAGSFFQQGKS